MPLDSLINRLERYSLEHPQEVLVVHACIDQEEDEIMIFKGFSSSLMRPTAYDLEVSMLPDQAQIESIDRFKGPFNPHQPEPIEIGILWSDFERRLQGA